MEKRITTPLTDEVIEDLRAGDKVLITGYIYTARDAAHKRMVESLNRGEPLPVDLKGQIIYYVGPTPPKEGQVIGSAGPTTAIRMDRYVEPLLKLGLKGMIGKGYRSPQVKELLKKYKAVYFAAVGGVATLLQRHIKSSELIAYEDLGTEAIRRLYVEDFPVIVANDIYGGDLFEEGRKRYARIDI
ncbi:Fe-S-containing hydro-lyase [Hydrogenivirga sp. 128-5-R1-1]|uniref:Fe-S-containing hydro-lyase n=1 Tax=Hydrogenivirga sp. 128-5-R1-1 TaxID=392423 RepID=UPI00015EF95E|nr:Fe-S-containing hydro-lyase [Hydrogenivirga sp. 128-5-R1-1]EDP74541.1 C-terminal fumarate hydratase, class I [Hydrogenivirga sp. 128-5-R1-1]